MIVYFVRYQTFEAPQHVCTDNLEKPAETWPDAKARRNLVFTDPAMRRCWVERIDRRHDGEFVVELSKERWGAVLTRPDPEPDVTMPDQELPDPASDIPMP